ncbi:MAG: polyprenyl synthetase family protein [Steroidobacteraceae bacterium]
MTEAARGLDQRLTDWRVRCERVLTQYLATDDAPTQRLHEAMRYSTLGGGKRLRPVLVYCTGEACGAAPEALDEPAAAVELIHVYSLVHDDLPAMDDDDLRRGRPTCHKAYDEGTAVLVGDALQALAFEVLAGQGTGGASPAQRLRQMQVLACSIGTFGMAGGQAIDLAAAGRQIQAAELEIMHRRKTGALIKASVLLGAIGAGVDDGPQYAALERYGAELGLAFQIQDDVLDVAGDAQLLGKQTGADAARGKPTYPSLHGLAAASRLAIAHRDAAIDALAPLGSRARLLTELAHYVVSRSH